MSPVQERLSQVLTGVQRRMPNSANLRQRHRQPNTDPGRIPQLLLTQVTAPVAGWRQSRRWRSRG